MRNQSLLVILLVVVVAALGHNVPQDNDHKIDEKENEIARDSQEEIKKMIKPDPKIPKALDPRFNKMLPLAKLETPTKTEKVQKKPSTTEKSVKDETSTLGE